MRVEVMCTQGGSHISELLSFNLPVHAHNVGIAVWVGVHVGVWVGVIC